MLLPKVYASNFTAGQSTLEAALIVLRTQLHMEDEEGVDVSPPPEIQELGSLQLQDEVSVKRHQRPISRHDESRPNTTKRFNCAKVNSNG